MFPKPKRHALLLCCIACLLHAAPARAADLIVLSTLEARAALEALAPAYEKSAGHRLQLNFAPATELQQRIAGGARFDVAILPAPLLAALSRPPLLREPRDLARAGMGLAVRAGSTRQTPRNAAQLRELLLGTNAIATARDGACGERFLLVLENLGAAEAVAPRLIDNGGAPLALLAAGRAELAIAPAGEIAASKSVTLLAPWPPEVQCYQTIAGALSAHTRRHAAARDLLRFIAAAADAGALRAQGQEPLAPRSN